MEYWFKKKGQELDMDEWKTADYLQMGKRGAKGWTRGGVATTLTAVPLTGRKINIAYFQLVACKM